MQNQIISSTYDYNQVLEKTLEYFHGDSLAAEVWVKKYALQDSNGKFLELTPSDMHRRMAREFYRVDSHRQCHAGVNHSEYGRTRNHLSEQSIFDLFDHFRYITPQGSVMSLLGNPYMIGSLSNCVVMPSPFDSYGGICYTDQQLTQLFKRRCGVGIDISTLRPENQLVSNAARSTSGAVSFMSRFSNTTKEVCQNGRRGALMISMDVAHPDIEKFIRSKLDTTSLTGCNISVKISDEFMNAVSTNSEFMLRWPVDSSNPIITKSIDAAYLWDLITKCARDFAEPGIIFWDRQHHYSTSSYYPGFENLSTNPCAEIAMNSDSCRLLVSILLGFVNNPFTPDAAIDYDLAYRVFYEAQRLADVLVDLELEHVSKILDKIENDPEPDYIKDVEKRTWELLYKNGKDGRRTGTGITGLGDMIAYLGYKYDSDEALEVADQIMRTKLQAEFDCSVDMAIELGSFSLFDPTYETSDFIKMMKTEFPDIHSRMMKFGRRNISLSTSAPAGSVSCETQSTSGPEPAIYLSHIRRIRVSQDDDISRVDFVDDNGDKFQEFKVFHPGVAKWMNITGETDITKCPYYGSTATEIDWEKRLQMQAVLQKYITHSISSTINLPEDVPFETVRDIYTRGWKLGLKGLTVYRENSRSGILVKEKNDCSGEIVETCSPKRPKSLPCQIHYSTIQGTCWIFFVGLYKGKPYEIFGGERDKLKIPGKFKAGWIVKDGLDEKFRRKYNLYLGSMNEDDPGTTMFENIHDSFNAENGSYTRIISTLLRHGVPIRFICEQLHKTSPSTMFSFERGIMRVLKKYIGDGELSSSVCPKCFQKSLVYQEGCTKCTNCGYSGCS